jgi:hypothetical protein
MWSVVRTVLLGIWVGGMICFAFLFAPIAFHAIGPTHPFAATIASSVRAITQTGYAIAVICAVITYFARLEPPRRGALVIVLLALAIALGAVETNLVIPRMEHTPLLTPAYDALHRQSSVVYGLALLSVLAAFILAAGSPRA